MVVMLVDVKQCQMEFGGGDTAIFIEYPRTNRFQCSWTGSAVVLG